MMSILIAHNRYQQRGGEDAVVRAEKEGFGKPLLEHMATRQGVAVRQPHNTHLSVLARLGLVGVAFWILFHFLSSAVLFASFADEVSWTRNTPL